MNTVKNEEGEERFGASGSERQRRGPCPGRERGNVHSFTRSLLPSFPRSLLLPVIPRPTEWLGLFRTLRSLPEVEVRLWGDETSAAFYRMFTRPHARYRVIQNKRWGVALQPLPDTFEDYLNGPSRQFLRRKRRHALQSGLRYETFDPRERLEEILAVNRSTSLRQGRPMDACYLDRDALAAYFSDKNCVPGVFDAAGVVKAYTYAPVIGDLFLFSRLLGHGDELKNGVMYLLISEVMREMIEKRAREGSPRWSMYDTYFGGFDGLRYFKEKLGFQPYKVRWRWG